MEKNNIKFNKYNTKGNYNSAVQSGDVDNATFSVVRTPNCNANENNGETGDIKDLYINDTKMTDVYNSRKQDDDLATSVTVGGIPSGTKLSDLTNMSLGEILDKIFFKVYKPQKNVSVSVSNKYSPLDVLVGSTYREFTSSDITYNLGNFKIEVDGETSVFGKQSNGLDSISSINYTPSDRKVVDGTNKIGLSVVMKAGDAPNDSEGNPCEDLKYNGGTFPITVELKPYYDWWATSDVEGSLSVKPLTKQDVVSGMGCKDVEDIVLNISGGNKENPQTIKIPGKITNCKVLIMGQYQIYSFDDEWTVEQVEENGKTYNLYVFDERHYEDGPYGGFTLKFDVETI